MSEEIVDFPEIPSMLMGEFEQKKVAFFLGGRSFKINRVPWLGNLNK